MNIYQILRLGHILKGRIMPYCSIDIITYGPGSESVMQEL